MKLTLRKARSEDCPALGRIARAAKAYWGYPEEWLALWRDELSVTEATLSEDWVCCAVLDGVLTGFYALSFDGADGPELEHLWVDPRWMGRGVGRRLLEDARAVLRGRGHSALRIASDPHAEAFYLRCGAVRVGEVGSRPEGRRLPLLELRP